MPSLSLSPSLILSHPGGSLQRPTIYAPLPFFDRHRAIPIDITIPNIEAPHAHSPQENGRTPHRLMGCGSSAAVDPHQPGGASTGSASGVAPVLDMQSCLNWPARLFHPNRGRVSGAKEQAKKIPKISIRVGMNVTRPGPYLGPKIAFIFGGPGTHKGRVVDDVAQMFGLTVISGEALLLKNVMDRVASSASLRDAGSKSNIKGSPGGVLGTPAISRARRGSVPPSTGSGSRSSLGVTGSTSGGGDGDGDGRSETEPTGGDGSGPDMRALQEILRAYSSSLTLEWLLQLISDEIDFGVQHGTGGFLIDIMPNMRHLLKCETLIKDCWDEMEKMEEKYPVLFAIDLAMPQDKLPKNGELANKTKEKEKKPAGQGGETGETSTSDEMDSYRMQRRYALYESAVLNFLQYFRETGRLVSVDASSGVAELIWQKIADFLIHMDFIPKRAVNCVIIFAFDEDAFVGMDITKYRMLRIRLSSLTDNPFGPVEELMTKLCRFIDISANIANSFAVELYGTSIDRQMLVNDQAKQILKKRKLFFLEVEHVALERYIVFPANTVKRKPSLASRRFQAVCLPDQAVCLFPSDTDPQLCRIISAFVGQLKTDRDPEHARHPTRRGSKDAPNNLTFSVPKTPRPNGITR
ncbi:hypothetical protein BV898_04280 [Hypsibius exemplaris]|uniref:Uncharacterized protein n=1 Tax=Hypsibius exemplaris TaxID=2072580 RepID=A0A1W0X2N1_HYPEX|nr:hypothetical protein BV898_04280 [Hypsibius exemplaris]